jgi:probable addiction module antidote protein
MSKWVDFDAAIDPRFTSNLLAKPSALRCGDKAGIASICLKRRVTPLGPTLGNEAGAIRPRRRAEIEKTISTLDMMNKYHNIAALAILQKKTGMGRERLYKTLSETGNPKWHTLVSLVIALGLNLRLA